MSYVYLGYFVQCLWECSLKELKFLVKSKMNLNPCQMQYFSRLSKSWVPHFNSCSCSLAFLNRARDESLNHIQFLCFFVLPLIIDLNSNQKDSGCLSLAKISFWGLEIFCFSLKLRVLKVYCTKLEIYIVDFQTL